MRAPRLAEGTELIGEYHGSGFEAPRYIIRRADGQVAQLPHLLYVLATHIDGHSGPAELAERVGAEVDREITPEQATFLVDERLAPVGILEPDADRSDHGTAAVSRPDPLFLLRYRIPVVPESVVWRIASPFRPLYWAPVLLVMLAGFLALETWLVTHGVLGQVVPSALALIDQPLLNLLVAGLIIASGMFHECGHVTACRYGGARPGTMGIGLYLVWPAMYSTVTDAYRLGRGGRLRVDLGGIYFNILAIGAMDAAYLVTGHPWLLIAIVSMHFETVWQLLPSIRLDGYYVLADLVGIPDLFSRFGPILRSLRPGHTDPRVRELKPWVRRTVASWVALVIPCLAFWLVVFILLAPQLIPAAWERMLELLREVGHGAATGAPAAAALAAGQLILLLLPWMGGAMITQNVGLRILGAVGRRWPRLGGESGRRLARGTALVAGLIALEVPVLGRAGLLATPPALWTPMLVAGLVLVAAALADRVLHASQRTRSWPSRTGWAFGLAIVVLVIGVAESPAAPPAPPPVAQQGLQPRPSPLARWIDQQTAATVPVRVPADLEASLRQDGIPAERLRIGGPPAPGELAVVTRSASPSEQAVARFGAGEATLTVVAARSDTAAADLAERQEAGRLLAKTSRLSAPPEVMSALRTGSVDSRALELLAALTAEHPVRVAALPPVDGEADLAVPAHVVVISHVDARSVVADPSAAVVLGRWLGAQQPQWPGAQYQPFAPGSVATGPAGMVLGWPVPAPAPGP